MGWEELGSEKAIDLDHLSMHNDIQFIIIDLFCGAGGTTTGFDRAKHINQFIKMGKVVACINHDHLAIKSHWSNHPDVEHFEEDITVMYGHYVQGIFMKSSMFVRLIRIVDWYRLCYPDAKVILWASLECTNFSKAKGGLSRDADSRTLANHLLPYIEFLNPDYIQIENVVEFMAWGPLVPKTGKSEDGYPCSFLSVRTDKKSKKVSVGPHLVPESRKAGTDWIRWRESINLMGYEDQWKEMNSADYGALTSRNRLFGIFAKRGLPIAWPTPTHAKNPGKSKMFGDLKPWQAVKHALDFKDEGKSVFNRKKKLSSKTFQRLYMGCIKHVAGGKDALIAKWNSNDPKTGTNSGHSVDDPCPTVTTQNRLGVAFITKAFSSNSNKSVNPGSSTEHPAPTITTQGRLGVAFISRYNGTNGGKHDNSKSVEEPMGALSCGDNQAKVVAHFIDKAYSGDPESKNSSTDEPCPTITTKPHESIVTAHFIHKYYSAGGTHQSIEDPADAIMTNDKHTLVKVEPWIMNTNFNNVGSSIESPAPTITADRHHHYLINPSWGGNSCSVESPCHVIVARQDKAPLYLISCQQGDIAVPIYEDDCEWCIKLKEFMVLYRISDIKMRMLKVPELKRIQGFPEGYVLKGNQSDQKKFIGNSVHPFIPDHWITALSKKLFPSSWDEINIAA